MEQRLLSCVVGRMPFAAKPTLDSDLFDELGFDSALLLDLILAVEDEFDCRFDEELLSIEALRSPRRILGLILAARRGGAARREA